MRKTDMSRLLCEQIIYVYAWAFAIQSNQKGLTMFSFSWIVRETKGQGRSDQETERMRETEMHDMTKTCRITGDQELPP